MLMMKGALALFMSLAIGYVLCILADKQKKGIKTIHLAEVLAQS